MCALDSQSQYYSLSLSTETKTKIWKKIIKKLQKIKNEKIINKWKWRNYKKLKTKKLQKIINKKIMKNYN